MGLISRGTNFSHSTKQGHKLPERVLSVVHWLQVHAVSVQFGSVKDGIYELEKARICFPLPALPPPRVVSLFTKRSNQNVSCVYYEEKRLFPSFSPHLYTVVVNGL